MSPATPSNLRRLGSRLALVVFGVVLALLLLEAALRVAGVASSREGAVADADGDAIIVLCIGDSHTWGRGQGVPARLAERLGERSARYRVINLGVPGTNTAQHRKRLDSYLDKFDPALIVFWGGLNNVWNQTDSETWSDAGHEEASFWRRLLDEIRILRFVRVWRHQAELNEILAGGDGYVVPEASDERTRWRKVHGRKLGDSEDVFVNTRAETGVELGSELVARVTAGDLAWMMERAGERGVPVLPITYPNERSHYAGVNVGIRWAARDAGSQVVDGLSAKLRLEERATTEGSKRPRLFDRTAHPTQELYDEIGDLTVETIDQNGLLPDASEGGGPSTQRSETASVVR